METMVVKSDDIGELNHHKPSWFDGSDSHSQMIGR